MKKILLSASLAVAMTASLAHAGGLAPVVVEEVAMGTKPASSVSPLLILGLLILVGVLVSRNNDDNAPTKK